MSATQSTVISMRLPAESGHRLKRMASRHGWTASDASARLVEEGLRRSEFAFIDFRDSPAGRQAYVQGSTLAVWEVILLVHSYKSDLAAVARHLRWPPAKVQAAVYYAEAFPAEIDEALAENETVGLTALQRMLPQTAEFLSTAAKPRARILTCSNCCWTNISPRLWQLACAVAFASWRFAPYRSGNMATSSDRTTTPA